LDINNMGSQQQAVYFKNKGQNQGELAIKGSRGLMNIGKQISNHSFCSSSK